jgi:DNA-binding NtrC family response regulator
MHTTEGFIDPFKEAKDAFVEGYFREALRETKGCVQAIAEAAGIQRGLVYHYLKKFRLDPDDFRPDPVSRRAPLDPERAGRVGGSGR